MQGFGRPYLSGLVLALSGLALAACQGGIDEIFPKAERPIPPRLVQKMKSLGMKASSPILIRIYKTENKLEVWKKKTTGRFALLETYEICKWSGRLGPKFKEGDRQAPEGFYNVGFHQLNPKSDYHLSFNLGYPNTFDRAHGRTGSHLMVHGACSSAGCYSMNDEQVEEIYSLARDALEGGQKYFQVQAFPFQMTAKNLARHVTSPHFEFWKSLKEGYDHFEITNFPPKVDVCEKRYLFNREAVDDADFSARSECPPVTMPASLIKAYKEKLAEEQVEFSKALRRYQLQQGKKDPELASLNPDQVTLVAAGSEVLPPPTPEPVPEPPPQPEPAPGIADGEAPAVAGADTALPGVEATQPAATAATEGAASDPQQTIAAISAAPVAESAGSQSAVEASPEAPSDLSQLPVIPVPSPAVR